MECHKAARRAAELGYTNLYIMPQGIDGWVESGKPVAKGDKPS